MEAIGGCSAAASGSPPGSANGRLRRQEYWHKCAVIAPSRSRTEETHSMEPRRFPPLPARAGTVQARQTCGRAGKLDRPNVARAAPRLRVAEKAPSVGCAAALL